MKVPVHHIIIHTFSKEQSVKCCGHWEVKETHKFQFELKNSSHVFWLGCITKFCSRLQLSPSSPPLYVASEVGLGKVQVFIKENVYIFFIGHGIPWHGVP
jgi:hypothetical protein